MTEIWKPAIYVTQENEIIDFTGLYEVSSLGNVRSIDRIVDGNQIQKQLTKKGKDKVFSEDLRGYYQTFLWKNNKRCKCKIHRLVAYAFPNICGEWKEGLEVNHKDFNKHNNCVDNLEWCTRSYNLQWNKHKNNLAS